MAFNLFDSTTTTTSAPPAYAKPYLQNVAATANRYLNQGGGFNPVAMSGARSVAPMDPNTIAGLQNTAAIAAQGNPLAGQSMGDVQALGQGGAVSNYYNNLYGQVGSQYGNLLNQAGNPYFAQQVQNQANLLGNDVQRQFGGLGRSGSAADTGALTQQIGQMRTQALSNEYQQNIANQSNILGSMFGQQQGILGAQSQNYLNAANAAPGAYAQQYLPSQYQMGVGQAYQQQQQQINNAVQQRQQQAQQSRWNRLGAAQGIISGAAGGYGTQTGTQTPSAAQFALAGATAAVPLFKLFPGV
jgi:hypothetical protein